MQLDKVLIIPLYKKLLKQQRHSVYRSSTLRNEIPKDLINRRYHTFIKSYKQLLFQI